MMSNFLAYKFRFYPTEEQVMLLGYHFDCCRRLYNELLSYTIDVFSASKCIVGYDVLRAHTTTLSKSNDFAYVQNIPQRSLTTIIKGVCHAWSYREDHEEGWTPHFKSQRSEQALHIGAPLFEDETIYVEGIGKLRTKMNRVVRGVPFACSITKTRTGKYFISINCRDIPSLTLKPTQRAVGIDLGVSTLIVTSNNEHYTFNDDVRNLMYRIDKEQAKLSKKQLHSKNYDKQARKIAILSERLVNIKTDCIHKATSEIVRKNDLVVCEGLKSQELVSDNPLARYINEASFYEVIRQLQYKSKLYNKRFIQVDKYFPSTQICSGCGARKPMNLKDRTYRCKFCGLSLDRDLNAARNILNQGLLLYSR